MGNGLKLDVPFDYLFKIFDAGASGVLVEAEEACNSGDYRKGGKGKKKKGANKKKGKKPKPCPTFNDTLELLTETSNFVTCVVNSMNWGGDMSGYNMSVSMMFFRAEYRSLFEYVWSEAEPCINSGGKLPLSSRCQDNFNEQELRGLQYESDVAANYSCGKNAIFNSPALANYIKFEMLQDLNLQEDD